MDDNVVFNPNEQNNQVNSPETSDPNAQVPAAEVPVDPAAEGTVDPTAYDPNAVDPNADPNAIDPVTGASEGIEGNEAGYEAPPAGGFFNGGLIKKILIGLGVLIVLIVIISLIGNLFKGAPKKVTLHWWGLWEDRNTMQVLINDFKKTHPNIDVVYDKKNPTQYREQLMTQIENGTGPDIFRFHNTWLLMLGKDIAPLSTDAISPDDFKNAYYPVMVKDLSQNGAIYGIPMEADSLELFVNPKMLEAAGVQVPTTWDEFNNAAKALTSKTDGKINKAGAALGTYTNVTHAPDIISLLLAQQGVTDISKITDYPKNESGALDYYGSFALGDTPVWSADLDPSLTAFAKGDLAMYFGFSWDVFEIQRLNSDLQFKVYPVPSNQGVKTTIASYWAEGVSAKTKNKTEAMQFMSYLAQKDTAQKFYTATANVRSFGELYARKDLQNQLQSNPLAYPFVQGLDQASSSFFASDTHDGDTGINSQMNTYLKKAVETLTGQTNSADAVIEDLNNGITQVLQNYATQ